MIAEHLAVIAHVDDESVLELAGCPEYLDDARELVVDQADHGVVVRLDFERVVRVGRLRRDQVVLEFDGGAALAAHTRVRRHLGLLVDVLESFLAQEVGVAEQGRRQ